MTLTRIAVPPPGLHQPQLTADGRLRFIGVGISNLSYIVESAPNLGPPIVWTAVATNAAKTNGVYEFFDPDPPTNSTRFYRVRSP